MADLNGKRVAILVTDGFEESELVEPKRALEEAGAQTFVVSPKPDQVRSWREKDWGKHIPVDIPLEKAQVDDFDALVLPGGVMNPDKLRIEERAVRLVRDFAKNGKPIAAICHGPWILIDAGVAHGRRLTSYQSIRADLVNAGGEWIDAPVVVDNGLVTSRTPKDLLDFNRKMCEEIAEGAHISDAAYHGLQSVGPTS